MPCSGYRNTEELRVQDESQSVVWKAMEKAHVLEPQTLPLSLDSQARGLFFTYYLAGASKCWVFLKPYYNPADTPSHMTLALDAVSLAYLWHQVGSDAALATARLRYILALRSVHSCLNLPHEASKDTTLSTSLLLDVFEKITDGGTRNSSLSSHIRGAFNIVKFRGIENFRSPSILPALVRLINHYLISCIASGSAVPMELSSIKEYLEEHLDNQEQTFRLTGAMIQYANLRSKILSGALSPDEYIRASVELEVRLNILSLNMPPEWQYSTKLLYRKSTWAFDLYFNSYPHRNICQAWNIIRSIRILLNELILDYYLAFDTGPTCSTMIESASNNIKKLAGEICASVPQYTCCKDISLETSSEIEDPISLTRGVGHALVCGPSGDDHPHTLYQQADCYILIFPLYVVGRSKVVSSMRYWVIKQLRYIGSHFRIRNAQTIARILEKEVNICPWEVFAKLGGYAFNV